MKDESEGIDSGDLVELSFLEGLAARLPDDMAVLKAVGDLYTRAGRYEDGLAVDRRLTGLCPADPLVWYNLACSQALLELRGEALQSLRKAVKLGYSDHEWMSSDADLRSLREEKAFKVLLRRLSERERKEQGNSGNA
jgi:predicted Zn-dependent protease